MPSQPHAIPVLFPQGTVLIGWPEVSAMEKERPGLSHFTFDLILLGSCEPRQGFLIRGMFIMVFWELESRGAAAMLVLSLQKGMLAFSGSSFKRPQRTNIS